MRRFLVAALCLACLSACSGRTALPPVPESEAESRWQSFERLSSRPAGPSVLSGSLRFGTVTDTRRVTYLLWSNGRPPVRLDVQAGAGPTVAKVLAVNGQLLLFLPEDHKAYTGEDDPDKALLRLGLPLPLGLADMAAFLDGHYAGAMGNPQVEACHAAADNPGHVVYQVRSSRGRSDITLSPQALPVRWTQTPGWDVRLDFDEHTRLPRKVEALLPGGSDTVRSERDACRIVLLIKERRQSEHFSPQELLLALPDGVIPRSLDAD
ncbi:MAG: hypothetical protein J1E80_09555 [Desulfovibrionaceae bacterium]|nr:hypothetical protein [Desulfovibrionaceae bacterium]